MTTYRVGDTIEYRTLSGQLRIAVVEWKTKDIKDGRPGFDTTDGHWGYDADVIRVAKRA
jgi:hypothetical protein